MHRLSFRPFFALAALVGLSLISCGREITGPDSGSQYGRTASLAFVPYLPGPMSVVEGSGSVVPFNRVRVILMNMEEEEVLSRTINFPSDADSVPLALTVDLPQDAPTSGLPLLLFLRYINAEGDTVFSGGPVEVIARPSGADSPPQEIEIELEWTGPGSSAVSVEISPNEGVGIGGTTTTFTAVARDGQGEIVPNAPIIFSAPNALLASLASPASGTVTWLSTRGIADIIASLPSGESDTARIAVELPPANLALVSGGSQSATIGSILGENIVLRVTASDDEPVAGVEIDVAVTTGGGTLEISDNTTDENGEVAFTWTLGSLIGTQTLTASAAGVASPIVISATGIEGQLGSLALMETLPSEIVAGSEFQVHIMALDSIGEFDMDFQGDITVSIAGGVASTFTSGTLVVPVVEGTATFTDLRLTVAGVYELRFEGPSIVALNVPGANVVPDTVADFMIVSGNNQTGLAGGLLADSLIVRTVDEFGNGVPFVTVLFETGSGFGTPSETETQTDEFGFASTLWTLGSIAGTQTLTATATEPDFFEYFVEFTAEATVSSGDVVWTGAVSNDWHNGSNWSTGTVPTDESAVIIPTGISQYPVLQNYAEMGSLVIQTGDGSIDLAGNNIGVFGSIDVPSSYEAITSSVPGFSGVILLDEGTVRGAFPYLQFSGDDYTLNGDVVTTSNDLSITSGRMIVGAHNVDVFQHFMTSGNGTFSMAEGSTFIVRGNANIMGGSTAGLLTGGDFQLWGDFTQVLGSESSFSAEPTHNTSLMGGGQSINFANPGYGDLLSHFGSLTLHQDDESSVFLQSPVYIDGSLNSAGPTSAKSIQSVSNLTVYSRGVNAPDGLRFRGVLWELLDGSPATALDTLEFLDIPTTSNQLTVRRAGGTIVIPNALFSGTPTSGNYILAEDTAPTDGSVLTIDVTGVSPSNHGGNIETIGGAQIVGWGGFEGLNWTGAVDNAWTNPSNWLEGVVPAAADSVMIPAAGAVNAPFITGDATIRVLVNESVDAVEVAGGLLTVRDRLWLRSDTVGVRCDEAASIRMTVLIPIASVRGTARCAAAISDGIVEAGGLTSFNSLEIETGGDFELGGNTVVIDGDFATTGSGRFAMMNSADMLYVGNMNINGGPTTERLTAGTIYLDGNFTQASTNTASSFAPSGSHRTMLRQSATVSFESPGTSWFHNLDANTGGLTWTLTSEVTVTGDLFFSPDEESAFVSDVLGTGGTRRLMVSGEFENYGYAALSNVTLHLRGDGPISTEGSLRFTDFDPTAIQLEVEKTSGTYVIFNADFETVPSGSGRYVRVVDPNGNTDGAFELIMDNAWPQFHNGFAEAIAPAILSGWNEGPDGFIWTGAINEMWEVGGNWSTGQAPGPSDNVVIPNTFANAPVLPVNGIFVNSFTSLRTSSPLMLNGTVRFADYVNVPEVMGVDCQFGAFIPTASDDTPTFIRGTFNDCGIQVQSQTSLTADGTLTITGSGDIHVMDGVFDINGQTVSVESNFGTSNQGRLRMTNPAGVFSIGNGATFDGQSTDEYLTAGRLNIAGNFTQGILALNSAAFSATGSHITSFNGTSSQQVTFNNPGYGIMMSHFANLELSQTGTAGLELNSQVFAAGQLISGTGTTRELRKTYSESDRTSGSFVSQGADVDGVFFNNVTWRLEDGAAITSIDNATITVVDSSAIQLYILRSPESITLNNTNFTNWNGGDIGYLLHIATVPGGVGDSLRVHMEGTIPGFRESWMATFDNLVVFTGWNPAGGIWDGGLASATRSPFREP